MITPTRAPSRPLHAQAPRPAGSSITSLPSDGTVLANSSLRVLIAHADAAWVEPVKAFLERHQLTVTCVADGLAAVDRAVRHPPDVVLLAVELPGPGGLDACRRLRLRCDTPVIAVADRTDEVDRVLALESGADDCVDGPTSPRELLARIRAQARRARGYLAPQGNPVQVGGLRLDPRSMRATLDGRPLQLTSYEFGLLHCLAERAGQVLTRDQLVEQVRGRLDGTFERTVDVHVSRLRQKLGDDPRRPKLLKTIRGTGYLIGVPDELDAAGIA